jgi:hypothetical protein
MVAPVLASPAFGLALGCHAAGVPPGGISGGADDAADGTSLANPTAEGSTPVRVAGQFDLGADFSFVNDPNGVWRYGYTQTSVLDVTQVALDAYGIAIDAGTVGFWHPNSAGGSAVPKSDPDDGGGGYYPYVAENPSAGVYEYASSWALRPGEVAMEASNAGQYAVVQFVAPTTGTYLVQARFEGIHFRLSTTDVHVLENQAERFSFEIDGYGGDPASFPVQGNSPATDYVQSLALRSGDVLTFAVGYGSDKTNYNDTTGLFAHLTLMSTEAPSD